MGAAAVLPSLLSLLVFAALGAAGAEDAIIRPAAAAGNNNKVLMGETTTLCCSNMTGFHECVHDCFVILLPVDAAKYCDKGCKEAYQCQTVSGDKCPSGQRSSSDDSSGSGSAKGDAAVDHCILGCNSSFCNKMVTGVGRKGVLKHAVERCNNACYKFCTNTQDDIRAGISTA